MRIRARRGTAAAVACAIVVGALLTLVTVWFASTTPRPHEAPVVIVGPAVVTAQLADDVNALSGRPFAVRSAESRAEGTEFLTTGEAVAVLVIDLAGTRDVLVLPQVLEPDLDRAVTSQVRVLEERYGRTAVVERAGPASRPPPAIATGVLTATAGWALVLVMSLVGGPFARTARRGLLRLASLVSLAVCAGAVASALPRMPSDATWEVAGLVALGVLAAGCVTLALEALLGLPGLLVAAGLILLAAVPLVAAGHLLLLAEPWSSLARWTVVGAVSEGVASAGSGVGSGIAGRPVAVLAGAVVLALAALVATRWSSRAGANRPDARPGAVPTTIRWRVQLAGVLAVVLAVGAGLFHLAPVRSDVPDALPSLASRTTCEPTGRLRSTSDLNRVTRLRGSPAFQGGDVGAEARLQDGRRLWMFGDTLRAATFSGQRLVRNSMLVVEPGCLQVVLPDGGGAILPDRDADVGYWPMSVTTARRPGYDHVVVMAQRVRSTSGDGIFAFENLGPAVAVYIVPVGGTPQLVALRDVGPDAVDTTRPMWGAAAAMDGGWLYLYGTARPDSVTATGFSLQVARVRPQHVLEPSRWSYWDGREWSASPADVTELVPSPDGVSRPSASSGAARPGTPSASAASSSAPTWSSGPLRPRTGPSPRSRPSARCPPTRCRASCATCRWPTRTCSASRTRCSCPTAATAPTSERSSPIRSATDHTSCASPCRSRPTSGWRTRSHPSSAVNWTHG